MVETSATRSIEGASLVGVPVEEVRLTVAALNNANTLMPPGTGNVLLRMTEVEVGIGRPDVVLLSVSLRSLKRRAEMGLRLHTFAEAQVLACHIQGARPAYSPGHVRSLTRKLDESGWLQLADSTSGLKTVIKGSMLLEAKVRDWRCGMTQLSRTRWMTSKSALLFPFEYQHLVSRKMLRHNKLGLLLANADGSLQWKIQPPQSVPSLLADLWLAELAVRHLETSHTF